MKGLHPILTDDPESPEARLLRAAGLDEPTASNKRRVLAAVGAGSGIAAAAAARTAAASASRGAGVAVTKVVAVIKVVAVAAVAAGATVGAAVVVGPRLPPRTELRLASSSAFALRPLGKAEPAPKGTPWPVQAPRDYAPVVASASELAVAPHPASAQLDGRQEASTSAPPVATEPATRRDPADDNGHLTQELAVLTLARQEVAASDPGGALRSLDQYERQFVRPQLEPEAMALRVEALVGLGRMAEARSVAGHLLASESGRAYANRVRSILEREEPGASGH